MPTEAPGWMGPEGCHGCPWRWPGDSLWLGPKPQICVLACPPPTPQSRTQSQMNARAHTHPPLLRAWQGHPCPSSLQGHHSGAHPMGDDKKQ